MLEIHKFDSPSAKTSLLMMDSAGVCIGKPAQSALSPGDILGMKTDAGTFGHIMLYVGDHAVAENTSSASRGVPLAPGTKLSGIGSVWERVQGVYRLGKYQGWQETDPVKVILQDGDHYKLLTDEARFDGEHVQGPVGDILRGMGYEVTAHLADQGKVYVKRGVE